MPDGSQIELKVRVGTPADVHAVMDLALMGAGENGLSDPEPGKILQDVWEALNLNFGILGAIGPLGGPLEGAVLLRITVPWYTEQPVLEERAIFVHPDYRAAQGGRAARLVEFSKKAAKGLNLTLMIGVLSNQRTAGKVRMYRRMLGEPAGAYFLFNGHTGGAVEVATEG